MTRDAYTTFFNMFMLMHVHNQRDLNDRNEIREKRLARRILLLRNMEEGLDHWTTGPLISLTEFVLTLWIESCRKATFEYMKQGLDHWTTGPLIPLTEFVLTLWIESC
jgi:hypothetical protein